MKQKAYKTLVNSVTERENEVNRVRYKIEKREAKKAVTVTKNNTYERLYQKLESRKGEKEVFNLERATKI